MIGHLTFDSSSEQDTDRFGRLCAVAISTRTVIALNGELGSGKTRFVRALCSGLGVDESTVNSPTFVLMQNYEGTDWSVSHFDAYRLADEDEFLALGAEEWFADLDRICVIEWAERVADILPVDRVTIMITQTGREDRRFQLYSGGEVSEQFLVSVKELLPS